jgi:RNA polymerase sigma-70 factor, ECF subfamily
VDTGGRVSEAALVSDFAQIYEDEHDYIWGLLYRLTGSRADADDLLMDTFERAMTRPPSDRSRPWRPWLSRVAVNLARDALRKRWRREYTGPWLPAVAHTAHLPPPATPEARYGARESASYAFLKALEVLTPQQRSVLVLRDVFDYATAETADALGMSCGNVKVTLHRARRRMAAYDESEITLDPDAVGEALGQLMASLLAGDAEKTAALLAEDVVAISDAGGEFKAALRPVLGVDRVVRFMLGLQRGSTPTAVVPVMVNGLPAFRATIRSSRKGVAEQVLMRIDMRAGKVCAIDIIIASDKLI